MQFSRTERRSIIGGDASKALPPKGSLPSKKTVSIPSSSKVRTLPLPPLSTTNGGVKPPMRSSFDGPFSLRPSNQTNPIISTGNEPPKSSQRIPPTLSREVPRSEVAVSGDINTRDKPAIPKLNQQQPPSWDAQISSNDKASPSIHETVPREVVHFHDEVSLPLPRTKSPVPPSTTEAPKAATAHSKPSTLPVQLAAIEVPKAATAHPKPLPALPIDSTKIPYQKSNSSSDLVAAATSSASHTRSKSNSVSFVQKSSNQAFKSSPNLLRMSTFQRVQQSMFLEEDLKNSGWVSRKSPETMSITPVSREPASADQLLPRRPRPTSLTQPLRPLDAVIRSSPSSETKVLDSWEA